MKLQIGLADNADFSSSTNCHISNCVPESLEFLLENIKRGASGSVKVYHRLNYTLSYQGSPLVKKE